MQILSQGFHLLFVQIVQFAANGNDATFTGNHAQQRHSQRGFARTGFADDSNRVTFPDLETDTTNGIEKSLFAEPVAAWQFEFDEQNGSMAVVGVENGSSNAFSEAPYFDREAVQLGRADRIIVADYSLEPKESLPVGRIRLATIHVRLSGDDSPEFQLSLIAAASADGKPVRASISMDRPGVRND